MFLKILTITLAAYFLSSCQTVKTRHQTVTTVPAQNSNKENIPAVSVQQEPIIENQNAEQNQPTNPEIPKIGIILGPGGARTFAHIALLQELQREKIPVHAIAGLEFGAPMAALFAWKGYANDVEWQMMKLKTEGFERRWLDPQKNIEFLNSIFQKIKVDELKLPYACLANNLNKNQVFIMSRGPISDLLPYCWSYPPVMKAFNSNVSGLRDPKLLADYLRSQGANYIVYVNVLAGRSNRIMVGDKDSAEAVMWQEIAMSLAKNPPGIDYVIQLNLENYGILEFDKRREILQRATETSAQGVKALAKKLNL